MSRTQWTRRTMPAQSKGTMNPNYLKRWPESYPVTPEAVREHLYGRPRIGDPEMWRQCAEYFDANPDAGYGICFWMDSEHIHGSDLDNHYHRLANFFATFWKPGHNYLWPCRDEFAPRRAALCRTVAALLEELQLNPPTA